MILGKYKELIERVEVTDDMRCRILDHISREPIERPEGYFRWPASEGTWPLQPVLSSWWQAQL